MNSSSSSSLLTSQLLNNKTTNDDRCSSSSTTLSQKKTLVSSSSSAVSQKKTLKSSRKSRRVQDAMDQLSCLFTQEEKFYLCPDYLLSSSTNSIFTDSIENDNGSWFSSSSSTSTTNSTATTAYALPFVSGSSSVPKEIGESAMSPMCVIEACAKIVMDFSLHQQVVHEEPDTNIAQQLPCHKKNAIRNVQDFFSHRPAAETFSSFHHNNNSDDVGYWRKQMFDWSVSVVECFHFDYEVIPIAFNILDRYYAKESSKQQEDVVALPITREDFQLFAMTSLYIAVKTVQAYPRVLSISSLVGMSNGFYTKESILETENEILQTLGWHVHPPTPYTFCDIYWTLLIPLLGNTHQALQKKSQKRKCQKVIERTIADPYFISKKSSWIALAVLVFVLQIEETETISDSTLETFFHNLSQVIPNVQENEEFKDCYNRLQVLYYSM